MSIIFYMLLVLRTGWCTGEQTFEPKTVHVGDNVNLTCVRKGSGTLFWIRLVSGNVPQLLGRSHSLGSGVTRFTASEQPGEFILHIETAELSDTSVYYCIKIYQRELIFIKGIDLRVEGTGTEFYITSIPTSDPVHPEVPATLQCSVLFDSENKNCPGDHSVYWFRAGSGKSDPSVFYADGENGDVCKKGPEAQLSHSCVYNFSKSISFSDGNGTYYCAVATCGQMFFGYGTKLDLEGYMCDCQMANSTALLLCGVLSINLIVVTLLICFINAGNCCSGTATTDGQCSQHFRKSKRGEDAWVYSAVIFTMMDIGARDAQAAARERIHDTVKPFGLD